MQVFLVVLPALNLLFLNAIESLVFSGQSNILIGGLINGRRYCEVMRPGSMVIVIPRHISVVEREKSGIQLVLWRGFNVDKGGCSGLVSVEKRKGLLSSRRKTGALSMLIDIKRRSYLW
jgi:hypothetical protein